MLLRSEMDNRIDGSSEYLACLVEDIGNDIQNFPAGSQSLLQQTDSLVFLLGGCENRLADALLYICFLRLKLLYSLVPLCD